MKGFADWAGDLVEVRPDERRPAALMLAYGFLAMAAFYVLKPVRNSVFVDRVGADNLPYVYVATALVVGTLMVGYSRYVERVDRQRLLQGTFALVAASLLLFWGLLRTGSSDLTSGAFYVWGKIVPVLLVSQFWLSGSLLFDTRQARRLYGPVGVGLILGGIAGSWIASAATGRAGTENLLLVSVALLGLCSPVVRRLDAHMTGDDGSEARLVKEPSGDAFELLRDSSHLRTVAWILGLTFLVSTLVDWQFNKAVELFIVGEDAKTAFFGRFFLIVNVASVVVQLLLTGWILKRFGAGLALLGAVKGLGFGIREIAALALGLTAVWAWFGVRMRREFRASVKRLIGVRDIRLEDLIVRRLDAVTLEQLRRVLVEGDAEEVLFGLRLLEHPSAEVRARAVEMLRELDLDQHVEAVEPLVHDSSLRVRVEAVYYLCSHAEGDTAREIMKRLEATDEDVRTAAITCTFRHGGENEREAGLATLARLVRDEDPATRTSAARLLSELGDTAPGRGALLEELLDDEHREVRIAAIRAVGTAGVDELLPRILEAVETPGERTAALEAMGRLGPDARGRALSALRRGEAPPALWSRLPELVDGAPDADLLRSLVEAVAEMKVPGVRYVALRGLNKLARGRSELEFRDGPPTKIALLEIRLTHRWTTARDDVAGADGEQQDALLAAALEQRAWESLERAFRARGARYRAEVRKGAPRGAERGRRPVDLDAVPPGPRAGAENRRPGDAVQAPGDREPDGGTFPGDRGGEPGGHPRESGSPAEDEPLRRATDRRPGGARLHRGGAAPGGGATAGPPRAARPRAGEGGARSGTLIPKKGAEP